MVEKNNFFFFTFSKGLDIQTKDSYKQTVIFYLAKLNYTKCLKYFLEKGINPNETDFIN